MQKPGGREGLKASLWQGIGEEGEKEGIKAEGLVESCG